MRHWKILSNSPHHVGQSSWLEFHFVRLIHFGVVADKRRPVAQQSKKIHLACFPLFPKEVALYMVTLYN